MDAEMSCACVRRPLRQDGEAWSPEQLCLSLFILIILASARAVLWACAVTVAECIEMGLLACSPQALDAWTGLPTAHQHLKQH